MVTFYEYLDWWVEELYDRYISLRFSHSFPLKAHEEFGIFGDRYDFYDKRTLTFFFEERIAHDASKFLNEVFDRILELTTKAAYARHDVSYAHALIYMFNLFVASFDYNKHKPKDKRILEETFIEDVSILYDPIWKTLDQEPLWKVVDLISFWEKNGDLLMRKVRVNVNHQLWGLPLDFEMKGVKQELNTTVTESNPNRELAIAHDKIKLLKKKTSTRYQPISEEKLKELIDKTRKKNGKHNYAAIGRELGIDNETAKRLVLQRELVHH